MPKHRCRNRYDGQITIFYQTISHLGKKTRKSQIKKWSAYRYIEGILKEGFSPYSSPVMLISRKVTQDKRVVMGIRHLNVRIVKNNLAYPLVNDTFSVLGNSKCEVLSVLDLKDAFYSLRLSEDSKRYCGILPYLWRASYIYQRVPMGLNISSSIWQSYINAILECLQSRKHCEAIMDNCIIVHTFTKGTYDKIRFIKSFTQEWS